MWYVFVNIKWFKADRAFSRLGLHFALFGSDTSAGFPFEWGLMRLSFVLSNVQDGDTIDDLRDSIKAKMPSTLKGVDSVQLQVFSKDDSAAQERHPLTLSTLISSISDGLDEQSAFLVFSPEPTSLSSSSLSSGRIDPVNALQELCRCQLTPQEITALYKTFNAERQMLLHGHMNPTQALELKKKLSNHIHSKTRTLLESQKGYIFDGAVAAYGGAKSSLFKAISPHGKPVIAKAYALEDKQQAQIEWNISQQVHTTTPTPFLMKIEDCIETPGHIILILPTLAISLSEILDSTLKPLPHRICLRYAFEIVSAIQALSTLQICHADIHLGNVMLDVDGHAILIDLGSCVPYGKSVHEHTPQFCLDTPPVGSLERDLACLCSVLVILASGSHHGCQTRVDLLRYAEHFNSHPAAAMAILILNEILNGKAVEIFSTLSRFKAETLGTPAN